VVCGNEVNERHLDRAAGMQALLNLLEDCPHQMKYVLTSCLANLLENKALLRSVYHWRSRHTRRGAVALILKLWDQETDRINKEEREHVEVHNQRRLQEEEMESSQLVDFVVSGNLHTKFHALLRCLNFDAGDDFLSNDEQKKLILAQHYLDDKDATLWRAFSRELGEEVCACVCVRVSARVSIGARPCVCSRGCARPYACVFCAHVHACGPENPQ
jgi:hypothetical protein